MLKLKGFLDKWVDCVMQTITGRKVCIKVNDNLGTYFPTHKGLRQGDSMLPLIFYIAADAPAMMLDNGRINGVAKGVLEDNIANGINMLQYADDTIFLLRDDYASAHNLKFILCLLGQMSRLKLVFIRVNYSCLEMQPTGLGAFPKSLPVMLVLYP